MRNVLLSLLAFWWLIGCGNKQSSPIESAADSGFDGGGLDGGPDGGRDGGGDGGLNGYETSMSISESPWTDGDSLNAACGVLDDDANICCTTHTDINCQTPRDGGFSPARRMAVLGAGVAPVSVDIFSDTQCQTFNRTVSGIPNFTTSNLWAINVDFTPLLPIGSELSMIWTVASCPPTACVHYTIGLAPDAGSDIVCFPL